MEKKTLKATKDDSFASGYRYQRIPRNWKERFLKFRGWEPEGIALLNHERYNHAMCISLDAAWAKEMAHLKKVFRLD